MIRVSDRALMRFLTRAGGCDIEALREVLAESLERAASAARAMGQTRFTIVADGLVYPVVDDVVTTVLADEPDARIMAGRSRGR